MYRWPWRRFEAMFRRHLLRKAREEMREMRDRRLAAIDANTNWDSKENRGAREELVRGLHEAYQQGVHTLYSDDQDSGADEEMENDPLFAPMRRRAAQMRAEADQPIVEQAGMGRQLIEAT